MTRAVDQGVSGFCYMRASIVVYMSILLESAHRIRAVSH